MTTADVADVADILAATGRTVPAHKWVPELADAALAESGREAEAALFW